MPREDLAAEIGSVMAGIERDMRERASALEEMIVRGFADAESRAADIAARIPEPREAELPMVPDEIAPLIARAAALLAEALPLVVRDVPTPAPVVNVTVPMPPQPAPRTERSRVKHDAQGRVVEIERVA